MVRIVLAESRAGAQSGDVRPRRERGSSRDGYYGGDRERGGVEQADRNRFGKLDVGDAPWQDERDDRMPNRRQVHEREQECRRDAAGEQEQLIERLLAPHGRGAERLVPHEIRVEKHEGATQQEKDRAGGNRDGQASLAHRARQQPPSRPANPRSLRESPQDVPP